MAETVELPEIPDGFEIEERDGKKFLRKKIVPPNPPNTPDIVSDKNAKRIRDLESKLAQGEESNKGILKELSDLREIVRKAGETKLPVNPPKTQTVLGYIEDLLFPPTTPKQ